MPKFPCPHCDHSCKSQKGLAQHIKCSDFCRSARETYQFLQEQINSTTGKRKTGDDNTSLLEEEQAANKKVRASQAEQDEQSTTSKDSNEAIEEPEPEEPEEPEWDDEGWLDPYAEPSDCSDSDDDSRSDSDSDDDDDQEDAGTVGTNQGKVEESPVKGSKTSMNEFK